MHTVLVNTPVTVRNEKGQMVHNLEVKDFRITDNGVEQKITHFDLGSEPISMVVVVETSSTDCVDSAGDPQDGNPDDADGDGTDGRSRGCGI